MRISTLAHPLAHLLGMSSRLQAAKPGFKPTTTRTTASKPSAPKAKPAAPSKARGGNPAPKATFDHLDKHATAVPVTRAGRRLYANGLAVRADDDDDDDTTQVPTIPCDMCAGSGSFGDEDCPACDGEGKLTPSKLEDNNKDFVDQFKDASDKARGLKPCDNAPAAPKPGSLAAQILAAGKRARGEKVIEPKPPGARIGDMMPKDTPASRRASKPASLAAQVIAAGKQARGEG